jgi:hypothetical protein
VISADDQECCAPLAGEPAPPGRAEELAPLFKALADPMRAALTGRSITIPGLGSHSPQGDLRFADVLLPNAGADVTITPESVTVTGPPNADLHGITVNMQCRSRTSLGCRALGRGSGHGPGGMEERRWRGSLVGRGSGILVRHR